MCCTSGRATGLRTTRSRPRRSGTRSPDSTSSEPRSWWSWRCRRCSGTGRRRMLRGWIELLPEELLQVRPVLSNGVRRGAAVHRNHRGGRPTPAGRGAVARRAGDQGGDRGAAGRMVVADEAEFRRLPAGIAVHRAGLALVLGDLRRHGHPRPARLVLFDEDDDVGRGAAAALIGLASWTRGDLEAAHAAYAECTARMERAGHLSDVLGCSITLADLRITQGRLRDAMRTYEHALQVAPRAGRSGAARHRRHVRRDEPRSTASTTTSGSPGSCWRGPRSSASTPGCRRIGIAGGSRWLASVEAEGDLDAALDLLDEAERVVHA